MWEAIRRGSARLADAIGSALTLSALAIGTSALTLPAVTSAQDGGKGWKHPVTPWGDPDLQGRWPIRHMTLTPLERPVELGTRAYLTDEEFAERVAAIEARNTRYEKETSSNQMGMGHWAEAGQVPQRQASLIVDPPNGRLPALTEAGRAKSATMRSSWQDIPFDTVEDFDTWDRCITRGLPASMFPMQYNNGIEIWQTPGYVVIRLEMIHEVRIVPLDGRPPLDPAIKQWMGESRGRWEGNTLVVETTNFNGMTPMVNVVTPGAPPGNNIPTSESMRIVERFTRIDDDTINYEITTYDPETMVQPWTAAYPWKREPDYVIYEYACHEGNTAIRNYIETSRYERAHGGTAN
ncbi:MAG: hypothetical protein C0P79_008880 [Gammaproteobacteria bacterium]|nr:hypothetical protein [Gammaproteobacteria bacterium]